MFFDFRILIFHQSNRFFKTSILSITSLVPQAGNVQHFLSNCDGNNKHEIHADKWQQSRDVYSGHEDCCTTVIECLTSCALAVHLQPRTAASRKRIQRGVTIIMKATTLILSLNFLQILEIGLGRCSFSGSETYLDWLNSSRLSQVLPSAVFYDINHHIARMTSPTHAVHRYNVAQTIWMATTPISP